MYLQPRRFDAHLKLERFGPCHACWVKPPEQPLRVLERLGQLGEPPGALCRRNFDRYATHSSPRTVLIMVYAKLMGVPRHLLHSGAEIV
jgi:hypothetical protein